MNRAQAPRRPGMSLQRRLLLVVLVGAPVVWLVALAVSVWGGNREINELFDTQQIRIARQVAALLPPADDAVEMPQRAGPPKVAGAAEFEDLAVVVWSRSGRLVMAEQDRVELPFRDDVDGFLDLAQAGERWRVYYLDAPAVGAVIAVGQRAYERDELLRDLLLGQALPWLLMLLLLLLLLAVGIRRVMAPVVALARDIESRPSSDLTALPNAGTPVELAPLVEAINRLFGRIAESIEHDRRFTADAAHELRTPLAATRAQWEVATGAADPAQRAEASRNVVRGLDRMSGLVSQLLALARLDTAGAASFDARIDWNDAIGRAVQTVLPLADRRGIEIAVDWVVPAPAALPLVGNVDLVVSAVRNLLDNAVRYAPSGTTVSVVCDSDAVTVIDDGPGVPPAVLSRLGDRFFRAGGQETQGSGLGLSIVARIARLHALALTLRNRSSGGFAATLSRRAAA